MLLLDVSGWESEIRERMRTFSADGPSVSIKVRAPVGCFRHEHSPYAHELIDELVIPRAPSGVVIVEHESGPEILVMLSLIAAGGQGLSRCS